jgi:polar amino acid transport system permease protein
MSDGFHVMWLHREQVIAGFVTTVWLSALAAIFSLLLGAALSIALMTRSRVLGRGAQIFVDAMRCVPFLLFAYFIYFGLPSIGVRLDNWASGLLALIIYNTAYMAEIVRGAWAELPASGIEAAKAGGFSGFQLYRWIILPPVLLAAAPVIGNQLITIIKDSAFLMIISVPELTESVSSIQATYFIPFAAFLTAGALYWTLCVTIEWVVASLNRRAEAMR